MASNVIKQNEAEQRLGHERLLTRSKRFGVRGSGSVDMVCGVWTMMMMMMIIKCQKMTAE